MLRSRFVLERVSRSRKLHGATLAAASATVSDGSSNSNGLRTLAAATAAAGFLFVATQSQESTPTHCDDVSFQRFGTIPLGQMEVFIKSFSTKGGSFEDKYDVNWTAAPLGEGGFGTVHLATNKKTGEKVAVKKINKENTGAEDFQREMRALMQIR
jgi:hypothetical protein